MADPPQQQPPPPSPSQPPAPKRTKKSKKTGDPRDEPGATVHALAHNVMGRSPAVHAFGNINYNKTFIRGIVIEKFDSRKPGARCAQWSLRVKFYPPSYPEGKVYEILRQHCKYGEIPSGANPQQNDIYPSRSLDISDPVIRGSTTYVQNAMGTADNSSTAGGGTGSNTDASDVSGEANVVSATNNNGGGGVANQGNAAAVAATSLSPIPHAPIGVGTPVTETTTNAATDAVPPPPAAAGTAPTAPQQPAAQQQRRRSTASNKHNLQTDPLNVKIRDGTEVPVLSLNPPNKDEGTKWVDANAATVGTGNDGVNKKPVERQWYQLNPFNEKVCDKNDQFLDMSRLESFLLMMPPAQLQKMLDLTNANLQKNGRTELTKQELIKFLGVCLLMTRFDMPGRKRDFWGGGATYSKHVPAPDLNSTGMKRHRFEEIWAALQFSFQPELRPEGMSDAEYRWLLVDGFVEIFNKYRAETFHPGGRICIDESILRWYGLGGKFVNKGLPHYVEMERKPENGCEIQNAACVDSGIMIQLKVVKGKEEEERLESKRPDAAVRRSRNHGTNVVLDLTKPWSNTLREVLGDSAFASVMTANEVSDDGNIFTGCIKTATKNFPAEHLEHAVFAQRGDRVALAHVDEDTATVDMIALAWLDRNRRKFITTAHGLEEGNPILRERWRQLGDDPNAPPQQVCIQIPQPLAVERYYEGAGTIDVSNKVRQHELMMDRRLQTNQWDYRVNFGILGIIFTDTWYLYQQTVAKPDECPNEFFSKLADEMIDNTEGVRPSRARVVSPTDMDTDAVSNVVLRQTLRKRKGQGSTNADGSAKAGSGRCGGEGCNKYTSWVCGACTHPTDPNQRQTWYCRPMAGCKCTAWEEHKNCMHSDTLA